jgi:hypothetical protein
VSSCEAGYFTSDDDKPHRREIMQVNPDWQKHMSIQKFEEEFHGVVFSGPGFYLSKHDTMLIVPLPPDEAATKDNVWNRDQPVGTIYDVCVFNCQFKDTVYSALATAPVRADSR